MTAAKNIRKYRKLLGLTQEQLAISSGLSLMSIRRYESGDRHPNAKALQAICSGFSKHFLHITPQELLELRPLNAENAEDVLALKLYFAYDQLNEEGRKKAVERIEELAELPRYRARRSAEPTDATPERKDALKE